MRIAPITGHSEMAGMPSARENTGTADWAFPFGILTLLFRLSLTWKKGDRTIAKPRLRIAGGWTGTGDNGRRFVGRSDELLTASLEFEQSTRSS